MNERYNVRQLFRLGRLPSRDRALHNSQYLAATAVLRRLYQLNKPGVILADEVGLGKTYVAYGVAAWLLLKEPKSRVLVLTNSQNMIDAWEQRWQTIETRDGSLLPECTTARSWVDYRNIPSRHRLVVSSYETLKLFGGGWDGVRSRLARWLFRPEHRPHTKLSATEAKQLKRDLGIDLRRNDDPPDHYPSTRIGRRFWKQHFRWDDRQWVDRLRAQNALDDIEICCGVVSGRVPHEYDLVIVDEAHRLEAQGRQTAMQLLLKDRTRKLLYVTATPFALDVRQFEGLLKCFRFCNGCDQGRLEQEISGLGLRDFEHAVIARQEYPDLKLLESRLRQWVVRRTWSDHGGAMARIAEPWPVPPDLSAGFIATVALERAIAEMLRCENSTHIASRRAGLCSSWAAVCKSLKESPIGGADSSARAWADRVCRVLSRRRQSDSPKLQTAARKIAAIVRKGSKVLVFSERTETLTKLNALLRVELEKLESAARKRHRRWANRLRRRAKVPAAFDRQTLKKLLAILAGRLAASDPGWGPLQKQAENLRRRLSHEGGGERWTWVGHAHGRPILRAAEIFDGQRGDEFTLNRFNLPGMPWVLLSSKKGQESIDLHHECNTVVLLDPVWNPAHREQRIGRVHRLNSRFEKVRVIDVWTQGTYEEQIHRTSMQRAEMMRVLLGAGGWLNMDRQVGETADDLVRYHVNLAPKRKLIEDLGNGFDARTNTARV